LQGKLRFF